MTIPGLPDIKSLAQLARELLPGTGACPFVIDPKLNETVSLWHFDGGRDATYVIVSDPRKGKSSPSDSSVTIRYAPFVEGTTIIYDATAETMQGKARPFVCRLGQAPVHVYVVMPFQIERIFLAVCGTGDKRAAEVAFLDARDEVIQAALPFQWRVSDSTGNTLLSQHASTNRQGRFTQEVPSSTVHISIHSCLTGDDQTLTP